VSALDLFEEHRPTLFGIAYRMLGSAADAEDIVQDAWLKWSTVDVDAERKRLEKDLAAAQKELAQTAGKLGNEAFLAKAPEAVVDKIKARQQLAAEEVERITARLGGLR